MVVCGGLPAFHCSLHIVPNSGGDLWWFAVISGRLRWFVVVWDGLRWFAMVCLIVIPEITYCNSTVTELQFTAFIFI